MDKTHCSYKEVPFPLLLPAQLHWRLNSHLFQGLPEITWLLYSRYQFFTFFGLSSHFPPQAIRHISLPIIPEMFCVYLTSSPCQKPLFLSWKLHLFFIPLPCTTFPANNRLCSTTPPRQWVLGVFPHCSFPHCSSPAGQGWVLVFLICKYMKGTRKLWRDLSKNVMVEHFHCTIRESWFYLCPAPEMWCHSSAKWLFRLHVTTPCLTSLQSETGKGKKREGEGKGKTKTDFFSLLPRKFPEKTHLLNLVFWSYQTWWCHKHNTKCTQTSVNVQILHKSKTLSVLHWIGKCFSQIL